MNYINAISDRARVIATSFVTYALVAVTVINLAAPEIVEVLPLDWRESFVVAVARIVTTLGVAVTIIRRVAPIAAADDRAAGSVLASEYAADAGDGIASFRLTELERGLLR